MIKKNPSDFTLMLVDDSLEEMRILVSILKYSGYRLITCRNGKDALNRVALLQPDLILLDVRMPYMDGFATIRLLKADTISASIPVIFLSAANDIQDRLEGLKLGAVDYIVKPAAEEEVLLRVAIHLPQEKEWQGAPLKSSPESTSSDLDDLFVDATCKLLNNNLSAELSIDEIARKVGCTRHKLSHLFKTKYGCTVFAWWREKKMQMACNFLIRSDVSVQGISDDLGFSSAANFSTAFRDRFGVTPSEYRVHVDRQSFQHPESQFDSGYFSLVEKTF